MSNDTATGLFALLGIVVIILVYPVLMFIIGALMGWVLANVFPFAGQWLIDGASLLGIKDLSLPSLPLLTATLGFIGSYFRSSSTKK